MDLTACRECARQCSPVEGLCLDCWVPSSPTLGWVRERLARRHGINPVGLDTDAKARKALTTLEPSITFGREDKRVVDDR
jgi:hypothetical protein